MEMRRYDANCILGRWADGGPTYRDAGELLAAMDELGIQRALVRHSLGAGYDPAYANALLREQLAGVDRLTPCWTAIPQRMGGCAPGGADGVWLTSAEVRAVCLYPAAHGYPPEPWALDSLLAPLAERRAVALIEAAQCDWSSLDRLCAAYPGLRPVVLSAGYRTLRPLYVLLERHVNLYVDISLQAACGAIEGLAARAGSERLLFGTGQPRNDGAGIVAALAYAELDAPALAAVAGGNLERLLAEVEAP